MTGSGKFFGGAALLMSLAAAASAGAIEELGALNKSGPMAVPAPQVHIVSAERTAGVFELTCGGARLQLLPGSARRFNAVVNDAGMAASLRAAASKYYEGEQRLVNVKFNGASSFTVADLQKSLDGSGYVAGQFAPRLDLLGGGRARLVLTYFRMNNSHSYDYNEVASFEFADCVK